MGSDGELLSKYVRGRGCWCCGRGMRERMFLRYVEDEMDDENSKQIWKRFAILPNIEGQKYTIGERFTSREEQGEFIFWEPSSSAKNVKKGKNKSVDGRCQVTIVKNQYWVTPLGGHEIWINDEKIKKKRKLNFGDYLSLEQNVEDAKKDHNEDNRSRFLFKERELIPEAFLESEAHREMEEREKEEKILAEKAAELRRLLKKRAPRKKNQIGLVDVDFVPGQNQLTLSHILSYLPFQDLKNARLVSKLWNEEATSIIKKKCFVDFKFDSGYGYAPTNESMKFFRYAHEMKNCQLANWEIGFPDFGPRTEDGDVDISKGKPGAKMMEDLDWFLSRGDLVKQLKLRGTIDSTFDYDLRVKILKQFQETIQYLELSGIFKLGKVSRNYEFPTDINFPKLQGFTMSMDVEAEEEEEDDNDNDKPKDLSNLNWLQPLIEKIKKVKILRLHCATDLGSIFMEKLNSFPNLEEISLHYTKPDDLKSLLRFNKPLKKLGLNLMQDMTLVDMITFDELLVKNCKTLESLEFIIPRRPNTLLIHLPVFPNLRNLAIGWNGGDRGGINDDEEPKTLPIVFPGGDNHIDYYRHVPSIQSLKLWPFGYRRWAEENIYSYVREIDNFWKKESFFDLFFPTVTESETPKICKTLQRLDIPYKNEFEGGSIFSRAPEIAANFPNVFNGWTNKAREPPTVPPTPPPVLEPKELRSTTKKTLTITIPRTLRTRKSITATSSRGKVTKRTRK